MRPAPGTAIARGPSAVQAPAATVAASTSRRAVGLDMGLLRCPTGRQLPAPGRAWRAQRKARAADGRHERPWYSGSGLSSAAPPIAWRTTRDYSGHVPILFPVWA